jgi:hypothetical protein
VVIFFFGLEALFITDSRVLECAVSPSPKLQAAIGYYSNPSQFLLASPVIRPVSNPLLSTCGPWESNVLLKCRHPHCVALFFYFMSLRQGSLSGQGSGFFKNQFTVLCHSGKPTYQFSLDSFLPPFKRCNFLLGNYCIVGLFF